jgi:hypothetical protein
MADEWYYAENGESFGPLSGAEVLKRVQQRRDDPLYVWREGMAEWTDARQAPEFAAALAKKNNLAPALMQGAQQALAKGRQSLAQRKLAERARHELVAYLGVSGYLLVWFSAVLFYKSTILRSVGIEFAPFALAAVKALILGKFMLVLEALKFGEHGQRSDLLIVDIVKKALLFTLALFVLSIIEEMVVGYFHGRRATEVLTDIDGPRALQTFASAILVFLVLLPYLAFRRLALVFGELPELLFTRRPPETLKAREQIARD